MVNGVGDAEGLGWRGRAVAAALGAGVELTAYDLGVRRDTSADVRARWEREALEPDLRAVADRHGVPFLPIFEWCRTNAAWTEGTARGDGTHPDTTGYAALAGRVLTWVPFRRWIGLG